MAIMSIDLNEDPSEQNTVTKSPRSIRKPRKSSADSNSALHKIKGKISKKSSKSNSRPRSAKNATKSVSSKLTFKDQKMHRMVFLEGGIPNKTEVCYMSRGKAILWGYTAGHRIFCYCCNSEVSPSQFEAHAGMASRKKPYENIFVSNGKSLHHYASLLKFSSKYVAKENDLLCTVCQRDGDMLSCHGCPRSFHKECISENTESFEKWFCKYCRNALKCLGTNANDVACEMVSELDPINQNTKHGLRIIDNSNNFDLVACAICRSYDFSEDGFNDQTVIVCDQCEKEYHIACLREHKKADLKELPPGNWFCTVDCARLHTVLKKLVTCGPEKVPDYLMEGITNCDMKWILLCGKDASEENRMLVTEAVEIFQDRFNPIIDSVTGSDFIPSMAYGLTMGASDFSGVYSAMLTIDSKVVTAGMFRVFGKELAELPIVATSQPNQGKGFFQLFMTCFMKLLAYLKIEKVVIPAANDAKAMWIDKFGFEKLTPKQLSDYRQTQTSMVALTGTTLLEKEVPKGEITFNHGLIFSLLME